VTSKRAKLAAGCADGPARLAYRMTVDEAACVCNGRLGSTGFGIELLAAAGMIAAMV